jgi:phage terminase large subunit
MKASPIFSETESLLLRGARRIIHQGGQNSGKTVNILGALAKVLSQETEASVNTVTSQSFPHLKGGALRDFETYVYPTFKGAISKYHRTDHLFTFKSGSILEFKVFETEMAAHGPKRKRLFINEANTFPYPIFFQLDSRSDQTIIDYNPSLQFWAHTHLIGQDGNHLLISDHTHNPFLSKEKHQEIENICQFDASGKVVRGDYELWKVYARGLTGNIQGIIFPNWQIIDSCDYPNEDSVYSVDFGYTNDPTCLVKQTLVGNTLFIKELAYESPLSSRAIVQILRANDFSFEESPLYCEHDPDMIRELRKFGVYNALAARKGPGSIKAGIRLLNTFDVRYTNDSRNIHKEKSMYIYEWDKVSQKFTNIPIEYNNHAMDAIRYGTYSHYLRAEAA